MLYIAYNVVPSGPKQMIENSLKSTSDINVFVAIANTNPIPCSYVHVFILDGRGEIQAV